MPGGRSHFHKCALRACGNRACLSVTQMKSKSLFKLLPVIALFALACDRSEPPATPEPVPELNEPAPDPVAAEEVPEIPETPAEPEFVHDPTSLVTVLGYHRFEDTPRDGLAISPTEFRTQLETIRDAGLEVISMDDFLAWRRGEKNIPPRSVLITIDDGYDCTYKVAFPMLQEFEFPFTAYVYTNYISAGGRSITWDMLEKMRDAGVDIGSHSISHASLTKRGGKSDAEYEAFLREELVASKQMLEERLGIRVTTFAYAYGNHNEQAQQIGTEAGYDALFTVAGAKLRFNDPAEKLGRWVVDTKQPQVFKQAINFSSPASRGSSTAPIVGTALQTSPANDATGVDTRPVISITLPEGTKGEGSEMRISGVGLVDATLDAATRVLSYQPARDMRDGKYTVIVRYPVASGRNEERWAFSIGAGSVEAPTAAEAPAQETGASSAPTRPAESTESIPSF